MALKLYFHPLSSYCQKAVIAFYENDIPFEPNVLNIGDPVQSAEVKALWPIGKFPVLRDESRGVTVGEASIIIEYLALHRPGPTPLVPTDPDAAWQMRMRDRFFDFYVNDQMGIVIANRMRPAAQKDTLGVEAARARLKTALDIVEAEMATRTWAAGDAFTMADCAAAPALFYANQVIPFADSHPHTMRYFERLSQRPSYARVRQEAEPYLRLVPQD
ncbi:glutathione S-transferase family protein [Bradyrhizobium sp. 2TAF24]|uniref:glutathione S-transferase family protein n=1 Tax=Bradyrhizobium sp. 2TAF24 TaxID=3233011 RepID=UPI003F92CB5B